MVATSEPQRSYPAPYTQLLVLAAALLATVAFFHHRGYALSPALWSLLPLLMGAVASLPPRGYQARIHFPPAPAHVPVRRPDGEKEKVSLRTLVETRCRALFADYRPVWWLFNGHLQTAYVAKGNFSNVDEVLYERTYLRLVDGGTLGIDITPVDDTTLKEDTPIVVVLHGLTGGSHESYVRAVLAPACRPVSQGGLGYRGVVMNYRGCAGVPVTSPKLYSAVCSDDLRQTLLYISHLYPKAPLYGVGFSLGANVLIKYLAEEGEQSRLRAACAIACPWNITANGDALAANPVGRFYSRVLGGNLQRLVRRHKDALAKWPDHPVAGALASTLALPRPMMDVFDQHFTRIAGGDAPAFPFASVRDYYAYASTHGSVAAVRVPLLALNAADDPVVMEVPMDAGGNAWATMVLTPKGGHLGWFERKGWFGVRRWSTTVVLEWLRLVVEDMALKGPERRPIVVREDGFLKEEGQEHLGCKRIDSGELVLGTEGESGGLVQGL